MKITLLTILAIAALRSAPVAAQQREPGGISVAVETTRDRFHYRFENPSSFGTVELVPHEFTQTYWGDNQWLVVRARFNAGAHLFESEIAATPQKTARGDDYDTFRQPSGDIVVAGTTGNVSMRSFRIRQTIGLGRKAGLDWNAGYRYRRDRSVFHPGVKTITHTQPSSVETSIIYTRETTMSENSELGFGAGRRWTIGRWRMRLGADVAPATRATLTTLLPDKYPGQTIVFSALVFGVDPGFTITRGNRWPVRFSAGYSRTFSYVKSRQFERNAATVGIGFGWSSQ